jgi:glycosyltransferase involved in cell wall biosynthesis
MQLEALAAGYEIRLVVVPVVGEPSGLDWAERHAACVAVAPVGDPTVLRKGSVELVRESAWRARLRRADPLPELARRASPALAGAVVAAVSPTRATPVHAVRAYLAPLAVAVAERIGAPWATLDLDDDDEQLLEEQAYQDEARAYGRLLETFGSSFAWLALASPQEASDVAERHGLATTVLPNAVHLPRRASGRSRRESPHVTLLLVGNLTYEPNVAAAETLARDVLPRVRRSLERDVRVELVGRFDAGGRIAELTALDGVDLIGYADDLDACYARADLVVAPLRHGGGTRIKVLEAFSFGVPVVTTRVGAAGLGAEDGRHLLIADGVEQTVAAVSRLAVDDELAASLAREARALVAERFSTEIVGRQLRELMPTRQLDEGGESSPT